MKDFIFKGNLTSEEKKLFPKGFDIIGDILIFSQFSEKLIKKEKIIGDFFLNNVPNVRVVAKTVKEHAGIYRTRKIKVIAGERRKETTHKENGVRVKLHVEKCYFSPRLSNERLRISKLIKKGEDVLVMFSGVGIYPLVFSKNSKAKEIYGVEINPTAHEYALENLKLNKVSTVKFFCGDVKKVLPKIKKRFDRIVMPLPKSAEEYLDIAAKKLKKNGVIHFYDFEREEEVPNAIVKKVKKRIKKIRKLRIVKSGQYGPGKFRFCFDFKVL